MSSGDTEAYYAAKELAEELEAGRMETLPEGAVWLVKAEEGYREKPYQCTADKTTIGYGFNVEAGVSRRVAGVILEAQLREVWAKIVDRRPWVLDLPPPVQCVLASMGFQLGVRGLMRFFKMWIALENRDWECAATEMLDSKWATQTKARAERAAETVRKGENDND